MMKIHSLDKTSIGILFLIAFVILFFSVLSPDKFFQVTTFQSIAYQLPELGLLTLGMFIAMLSGGLNLAIIATANITALFMAWSLSTLIPADASMLLQAFFLLLSLFAAILIAIVIGSFSGFFIAYIGIHPILVTLGVMTLLKGLGIWITQGAAISGMPPLLLAIGSGSILGIPYSLLLFLLVAYLLYVFLERTSIGKYIYMSGSNINATYFSGIDTNKVTLIIYSVSNVLCVFAGLIMMSRFNSARMGYGDSYLLLTVLAIILGGANPFGGFGKVVNIILALFVLQIISTGLNLLGVSQHLSLAMWGMALIIVLVTKYIFSKLR